MWSDWLAFCDCGFHSVCPLMKKDKRLMEASWWERLIEGKTGSCSDMLGPCSVNLQSNFLLMGAAVFPPCYLPGGQTLVEVMKIMVTSFRISHAFTATLSASNPAAGHHQSTLPLEAPGHSRASLGQSFVGSLLLSPGSWCMQVLFVPSKSLSQMYPYDFRNTMMPQPPHVT